MQPREEIRRLQAKYDITAWFYDILDFPWELQYRRWRPVLLEDVRGNVLEAGSAQDASRKPSAWGSALIRLLGRYASLKGSVSK